MTSKNLSTITTDVITSYGQTAQNVVKAYRAGGKRVIGFVDQRIGRAFEPLGQRLSPTVRANLASTQKRISGYYTKGIDLTTGGAESIVHTFVDLAANGVKRIAANAQSFDQGIGKNALDALSRAVLPGANAVHEVAGRIEEQTARIARRIAGDGAVVKAAKAARRKVAKAVPAARRGVRKVMRSRRAA
jgi:hypothetical protein